MQILLVLIGRNGSALPHNKCHVIQCHLNEFARTTPVRPPIGNRNANPSAHRQVALYVIRVPYVYVIASRLKILIPVGKAIIIVADVKYARASTSNATVNMWCARTTNPSNPTAIMAIKI